MQVPAVACWADWGARGGPKWCSNSSEGSPQPGVNWARPASFVKRLVERICAGEYIDFGELSPAKGRSRPLPQAGDG